MTGENPARAAARRLLAMPVPDNIKEAILAAYGVNLGADTTYEDLLVVRLRQLARVDLEAAALLKRYDLEDDA